MTYSLESFHFNPQKSGQIFRQLCKERGITKAALAARSGLSYDTVDNCLKGRSEITFERVFKFCVVLGLPIEAYMLLLLKDEDIDFADDVLLYDLHNDDVKPISDERVPEVPSAVPDSVVDAASAAVGAAPAPPAIPSGYSRDEMRALLDRIEHTHAAHVADLREQLARQYQIIRQLIDKR